MTPEQVADATAELIVRLALVLDRRKALSVGELLPIVEALATGSQENPALPAIAARISERLRAIEATPNRRSGRGVLDAQDASVHSRTPWQSHS